MYYPIMVNVQEKICVIVGGGKVAERKMHSLCKAGANVVIVSPNITEGIKKVAEAGVIKVILKNFEKADVIDAFLVIAATNSREVNNLVKNAISPYQLLNIVDCEEESNFIVPATFTRGKLQIAVSTSGASPLLSKKIITEIEAAYDESYEEYVEFLSECRMEVMLKVVNSDNRKRIFKELLDERFYIYTKKKEYMKRQIEFESLIKSV